MKKSILNHFLNPVFIGVIICLMSNYSSFSQSINSTWGRGIGGTRDDWGLSATDKYGNTYIAGTFDKNITIGSYTFNSFTGQSNEIDIFVCKYDYQGNLEWAKKAGGKKNDYVKAMDMDSQGNLWVAGYVEDSSYFENQLISIQGNKDGFVAKYSPNGDLLMVKNGGVSAGGSLQYFTIHIDRMGDVWVGGFLNGSIGSVVSSNGGWGKPFVGKLDPSTGEVITGVAYGSGALGFVTSITSDQLGNYFIGGSYLGDNFINGFQSNQGATCGFILSGNNFPNFQNFHQINTLNTDEVLKIIPDYSGGCLALVNYNGVKTYNRYNQSLVPSNSYSTPASNFKYRALGVSKDSSYYYLVGTYTNPSVLNTSCGSSYGTPQGSGMHDMFVMKYSFNPGSCAESKIFGQLILISDITSVNEDGAGNIYVCGINEGTIPGGVSAYGGKDVCLLKFGNQMPPLSLNNATSDNISFMPNPVADHLLITNLRPKSTVKVIDLSGRVIINNNNIESLDYVVDCSTLLSGLYFVEVENEEGKKVEKFIKQ